MKRVTIKDVAKEAGTSISAVSYVLNGSTEKKYSEKTVKVIKEAAKKLNYVPNNIARGMRMQKSYSIGIVNFWDIHNHVFVKNLKGIVETANKYKYSVVLCPVSNKDVEDYSYIEYFINKRIDGIVFIAPAQSECMIDEAEHIKRMESAGVPFVVINTSSESDRPAFFKYNFFDATYTAAKYLIERGIKSVTYVANEISGKYPEHMERLNGCRVALEESGLDFKAINVNDINKETMSGFEGVVASKSDVAKEILDKAIEFGFKIPEDFSIVAANVENYSEYLYVPLTCSHIPILKIAKQATEVLMNIINNKPIENTEVLKCEIIEGKSVKLSR